MTKGLENVMVARRRAQRDRPPMPRVARTVSPNGESGEATVSCEDENRNSDGVGGRGRFIPLYAGINRADALAL